MRWVVYLLLVVNLIVGLWVFQTQEWDGESVLRHKPAIGEIRVISREEAKIEQMASKVYCYRSDAFLNKTAAETALTVVSAEGVNARLVSETAVSSRGFWVILPLTSLADNGNISRLSAAGFEDAWVIPDGEYRNGISVGLFRDAKNAEARHAEIEAIGFSPEIVDRKVEIEQYYLLIETNPGAAFDNNRLNQLGIVAGGKKFSTFTCEEIAPGN